MSVATAFNFSLQTTVRCGPGVSVELPDLARKLGYRRAGLVVDAGVMENATYKAARAALEASGLVAGELVNSVAEPDYDQLDAACDSLRTRALDGLVAFGGGSTLDLAKGIAVLMTNPGRGLDYRGFELVAQPGLPVITAPTTAGTGSEITPSAVFTERREQRKFGINSPHVTPRLAILDPLLTMSCPRSVTVSSGMDAVVHTIESFVGRAATPMSRMLAREAFRLLMNNLVRVVDRPDDLEARRAVQFGAFYAAAALMNSGPGPAGALSYPLGARFQVAHGLAGAVFLAPVARWNLERDVTAFADLADLLPAPPTHADRRLRAEAVVAALDDLGETLRFPRSLREFGVSAADLPTMAEQTILLAGAINNNPTPVTREDLVEILARVL